MKETTQYKDSGETKEEVEPLLYQDSDYWKLPENVRRAMDLAHRRTKHSAFYYKLLTLNDQINIYKTAFYLRKTAQEALFDKEQVEKRLKAEREAARQKEAQEQRLFLQKAQRQAGLQRKKTVVLKS